MPLACSSKRRPARTAAARSSAPSWRCRARRRRTCRSSGAPGSGSARRPAARSTCRCRSGHQHVGLRHAGVVQRLEGHAGASSRRRRSPRPPCASSPFSLAATRHAERGRDRGRRMRGAEGVVLALVAAREAARCRRAGAACAMPLAAAGEDLVRIGLVADVPDDAVVRRVEDVVQRDRQLDRAEVRRQVAAGLARPTLQRRTRAARRRAA